MRVSPRIVAYCAVLAVAWVATAPPCSAQEGGLEADAEAAAVESAHEAEEAEHGEGASGPNPLAWDPDLAIWTLVVFVLLFLILQKFAWPQISAAIDEREKQIANNIAAAAAKNEDAKRMLADYEAKLAAAASDVRAMLEEARRDAERTKSQIVEEGRKAASDEAARAVREIERAKDSALHELAVTSANTAVELARTIVQKQLTPEQHKALVQDALGKLAAATPSEN
jgi:F-type H+-transporting ATPase subunit b